jgi:GH43 family beta-xylosidase
VVREIITCRYALCIYSLIKMVSGFCLRSSAQPTWDEIRHAILRNFDGLDNFDPMVVFRKHLAGINIDREVSWPSYIILM